MITTNGTITGIYEVSNPTPTIVKQRFLIRTDLNQNLFLTLFNNVEILNEFKVGDKVEVVYNSKSRETADQVFTDHFVSRMSHIKPIEIHPLEYFETGKHNLNEYYKGLLTWIEAHHQSQMTIADVKKIASEFLGRVKLPIAIFHYYVKEVVGNTPANIQIDYVLLLAKISERCNSKYDF